MDVHADTMSEDNQNWLKFGVFVMCLVVVAPLLKVAYRKFKGRSSSNSASNNPVQMSVVQEHQLRQWENAHPVNNRLDTSTVDSSKQYLGPKGG